MINYAAWEGVTRTVRSVHIAHRTKSQNGCDVQHIALALRCHRVLNLHRLAILYGPEAVSALTRALLYCCALYIFVSSLSNFVSGNPAQTGFNS